MDSLKQQMESRRKAVFESYQTDSFDRFIDFYESVYEYIDFIEKQISLRRIVENDRNDVYEKRQQVTTDTNISKWDKRDILKKVDRYSISKYYDTVLKDVYAPMKEYRELLRPAVEEHARGFALSSREHAPSYFYFLDVILCSIFRDIKQRNFAYFRIRYRTKMLGYVEYVKKMHTALINKMLEAEFLSKSNTVQQLPEFDIEESILEIGDKEVKVTLKNDKPNEHYILEFIFENPEGLSAKSYYSEIIEAKFPREHVDNLSMYRSCKALNAKISEQAGISNFLTIKSGIKGYVQINSDYL